MLTKNQNKKSVKKEKINLTPNKCWTSNCYRIFRDKNLANLIIWLKKNFFFSHAKMKIKYCQQLDSVSFKESKPKRTQTVLFSCSKSTQTKSKVLNTHQTKNLTKVGPDLKSNEILWRRRRRVRPDLNKKITNH